MTVTEKFLIRQNKVMKCKKIILLISFFCLVFSCQTKKYQSSDLQWFVTTNDVLIERGHEEITAQALLYASKEEPMTDIFYTISFTERAWRLNETILVGNFAIDFPSRVKERLANPDKDIVMVLAGKEMTDEEFGRASDFQDLHFLRRRNLNESTLDAAYQAGITRIAQLTEKAALFWVRCASNYNFGQKDLAIFWTGAALHTIQDSFSPAHTVREKDTVRTIKDICVYDFPNDKVCEHERIDLRDSIWNEQDDPTLTDIDARFAKLVPSAQDAVMASKDYLKVVYKIFKILEFKYKDRAIDENTINQEVSDLIHLELQGFYSQHFVLKTVHN